MRKPPFQRRTKPPPVLQCAAPGSSGGTELHYLRAAKTGSTSTITLLASASGSTQPGSRKGNWSLVLHQSHRTMRWSLPVHAHTLTTLREPCERFESGFHWARPRKKPQELPAFRYGFHRASRATGVSPDMTPLGWASQLVRNISYRQFWLSGRADGACQKEGSGSACFAVPQFRYVSNTTRIACLPSLGSDMRRIVGLVGCESASLGGHELGPAPRRPQGLAGARDAPLSNRHSLNLALCPTQAASSRRARKQGA